MTLLRTGMYLGGRMSTELRDKKRGYGAVRTIDYCVKGICSHGAPCVALNC